MTAPKAPRGPETRYGRWLLSRVVSADAGCCDCRRPIPRGSRAWRAAGSILGRRVCVECMLRRQAVRRVA